MTAGLGSRDGGRRWRHWRLFVALALVLGFQWAAIVSQSLSGDGAYHLIAGHQALRYGTNDLNLEHPPLVKMLIALPLAASETPWLPPIGVEEALDAIELVHRDPARLRRATLQGRTIHLVLFVVPFLLVSRALARRLTRSALAADLLLVLLGCSLAVLPNLAILQTDVAASLAAVATLLGLARLREHGDRWRDALLVGFAVGLGLASKFSAVLLVPVVVLGVLAAGRRPGATRRRLAVLAVAGICSFVVLEASYALANRDYDPERGRASIQRYCRNEGTLVVDGRLREAEESLLALERHDPRLAQWAVGFLGVRAQNQIGVYPSYAFGTVQSRGRWWYFPVLLLVKTPLVLLLFGLGLAWKSKAWRAPSLDRFRAWLPSFAWVAIYGGTAVVSNYNLGVRHLLPVVPLLYLPLAAALARHRRAALVVATLLVVESTWLAPLWMSATNTWWLGRHNPTRWSLSAGNLTYRQNFISLARAARLRDIEALQVVYPPLGDDILRAYLPEGRMVAPGESLTPGWYAVSVQVEQLVPALLAAPPATVYGQPALTDLARAWLPTWRAISAGEDHGYVAGTFHLYRLHTPWPPSDPPP